MDAGDQRTVDVTRFDDHLFERMRGMHRAWIENVQEIRQLELDFGARLMSADNPTEAARFCSEWMAKRMEITAHEQMMFANSCLGLLVDMMGRLSAASPKRSERDQ
jgi:hypothetical protein